MVVDIKQALHEARKVGYPVFIKAVAGGGGKGIRIAYNEEEFTKQFAAARAEAEASFGNPDVYLEKMIVNPRHIEVQILGDKERPLYPFRREGLHHPAPSSKVDRGSSSALL